MNSLKRNLERLRKTINEESVIVTAQERRERELKKASEVTVHLNKVFYVQLVAALTPNLEKETATEPGSCNDIFQPEFTHQIIDDEDERLVGYFNPLVKVLFSAASLRSFCLFSYDTEPSLSFVHAHPFIKPTPLLDQLITWMPDEKPVSASFAEFYAFVDQDLSWTPPGSLIHSYSLSLPLSSSSSSSSSSSFSSSIDFIEFSKHRRFEIYRSSLGDPETRKFHERAEFFFILFI